MKRIALILFAASAVSACTPGQVARWEAIRALLGQETAEAIADAYGAQRASWTEGRPCAQWYDHAIEAGFRPDEWPTVSRVMRGESNCDPSAYNRSGASGLMQVMGMWADDCGGSRDDLFDPAFNLACAKHVLNVSSWQAWEVY